MLFDIDYDGIQDILVATYDGEILAFKDTVSDSFSCSCCNHALQAQQQVPLSQGESLSLAHSFFVPPLKVRKDWYEGLDPDPIDHSHPDVGTRTDAQVTGDDQVDMPSYDTSCLLLQQAGLWLSLLPAL